MADKRISQLIERTDIANNDVLPIVASGATTTNKVTISTIQTWMQDNLDVGVTSVGLSMPSAFVVSNSPVTASGNITVTGAGTVAQYIRGDGSLADFPQSAGGGGASVSYYLNGSVSQGTIGGIAYLEMNKTPILGAGTDFTIAADGYIASFITDAGDPGLLEIPAGNWNFETYLSATSGGGSPTFYIELYKVNSGGTATLIASNSGTPESISLGTNINPYFSALAVPTTTLALTDRLALRYYVTHAGRTITLHTENSHLCQIITTFTTGLTALNGLTAQVQNFATGTSGTDFNISSAGSTHNFNIPSASATDRGLVTTGSQTIAGAKTFSDDAVINGVNVGRGGGSISTNTRLGSSALTSNTTGGQNTAVGDLALQYNTTGSGNTAVGRTALRNCITGNFNTAVNAALSSLTSGDSNSAIGYNSGLNIITGTGNSSLGAFSLQNNTTANNNTAIGYYAMQFNTTGGNNTAVGLESLRYNTGGGRNTSVGDYAMQSNTTGSFNSAFGANSLSDNTTGEYNLGLGTYSLHKNTTGNYNIAIGDQAGSYTIPGNNTISNNSIFIGYLTEAQGNNQTNQIVIGHNAVGNGSNTVTIGNSSITENYFTGNIRGGALISTSDSSINGVSIGKGANSVATNTRLGFQTLVFNTTGSSNTSVGYSSLYLNTTGSANSSFGTLSLENNTTGTGNTAIGYVALRNNTTGGSNTATGYLALNANTTGNANTANGAYALENNTTGSNNTAVGQEALENNIVGTFNTAIGFQALKENTNSSNTAIGYLASSKNTSGSSNFSGGARALENTTTGSVNTSIGFASLQQNTTGGGNVAMGEDAGRYTSVTSVGNTNGNDSVFIGRQSKPLGDSQTNQIVIGHNATGNGSNTVTLGNDSITNTYLKGAVTLTGALNGTSAVFSSTLTSTDHTIKNSANAETLDLFLSPSTSNGFIDYPSGRSLTIRNKGSLGSLILASTGAATFSSSVTANSLILNGSDNTIISQIKSTSGMIQIYPYLTAADGPIIQALDAAASNFKNLRIECNATTITGPNSIVTDGSAANINIRTTTAFGANIGGTIGLGGLFNSSLGTEYGVIAGKKENSTINNIAGYLAFYTRGGFTDPIERMRITSDGYARLSTNSQGIQFNGDTASANALDDYEEGTWTPVFDGAGSPSYSVQFGSYTKIGNVVYCTIAVWATNVTGSSTISIIGLPFSAVDTGDSTQRSTYSPRLGGHIGNLTESTAKFRVQGTTLVGVKGDLNTTFMTASQFTSGSPQITGNFWYYV